MKRHIINFILAGAALISASCSQKKTELEISLSDKFEGQTVEPVSYTHPDAADEYLFV